jgi:hypothetical protein
MSSSGPVGRRSPSAKVPFSETDVVLGEGLASNVATAL